MFSHLVKHSMEEANTSTSKDFTNTTWIWNNTQIFNFRREKGTSQKECILPRREMNLCFKNVIFHSSSTSALAVYSAKVSDNYCFSLKRVAERTIRKATSSRSLLPLTSEEREATAEEV